MERLSFDSNNSYDGLEASIHVARYLLASTHCKGRRVLDIACGEGYGSRMLKDWGATEVLGVDVSPEAIAHAQQHFAGEGVQYLCAPAEQLPQVLAGERYDLIVSLETIEHLPQPERFLADLRQALNPGGCIIISCPNDWWYFPSEQEKNPYHLRKYHFEQFRAQTEAILGPATVWLNGAPTFGFLNTVRGASTGVSAEASQMEMLKGQDANQARILPAEKDAGPTDANASYFVGVWGGDPALLSGTAALLPLSMDAFKKGIFQGHYAPQQEQQNQQSLNAVTALESELAATAAQRDQLLAQLRAAGLLSDASAAQAAGFESQLEDLTSELQRRQAESTAREGELRRLGLLRQAVLAENVEMRSTIQQLRQQGGHSVAVPGASNDTELLMLRERVAFLQVGHDRYVRLSSIVPGSLRRQVMGLKKIIRGR